MKKENEQENAIAAMTSMEYRTIGEGSRVIFIGNKKDIGKSKLTYGKEYMVMEVGHVTITIYDNEEKISCLPYYMFAINHR